jgi:hypothetical protein
MLTSRGILDGEYFPITGNAREMIPSTQNLRPSLMRPFLDSVEASSNEQAVGFAISNVLSYSPKIGWEDCSKPSLGSTTATKRHVRPSIAVSRENVLVLSMYWSRRSRHKQVSHISLTRLYLELLIVYICKSREIFYSNPQAIPVINQIEFHPFITHLVATDLP